MMEKAACHLQPIVRTDDGLRLNPLYVVCNGASRRIMATRNVG